MEKAFFELLTEISYGLVQKEKRYEQLEKDEEYEYFQQPELVASIQKLALFMLANHIVDELGRPLAPTNETDAIVHYFSKPLEAWPSAKHPAFQPLIQLGDEEDVLVHTYAGYTAFYTTEWSRELAALCRLYNEEAMQETVYHLLVSRTPEQYRFLRRYIVEHPIINHAGIQKFKRKGRQLGLDDSFLSEFIEQSYDSLPGNVYGQCGYCGWTVMQASHRKVCADFRCEAETDGFTDTKSIDRPSECFRLKPGVMRYMCLPGRDELALVAYCERQNMQAILWPDKDRYDVTIQNGNYTLAIDVKSYFSPYALRYHIEKKGVFRQLHSDEIPILVIPDHRIRKKGYIDIVTQGLDSSVQCVSMRELKARMKKEEWHANVGSAVKRSISYS